MEELEFFKKYLISSQDEVKLFGEVFTPIPLIEEMLDKLPDDVWSNKNLKWLDPANGIGNFPIIIYQRLMKGLKPIIENEEDRKKHILENMLYMVDISCKNTFICMNIFDPANAYDLNIHRGNFLTADLNEIFEIEKFDIIVGNPPYKRSLHFKFLDTCFDLLSSTGKLVFVHPSSWLILLREGRTKTKYDRLKRKIENYTTSLEFFYANKYFNDIGTYMPLEIIMINKAYLNGCSIDFSFKSIKQNINSLNDANIIGKYSIIKSIETKINCDNSVKDFVNGTRKNFFVSLSSLVGNGSLTIKFYDGIERTFKNMFNLVNSTSNYVSNQPLYAKSQSKLKAVGNMKNYVSFKTNQEAQNFLDFITKSKLCKYILLTYNIDQHIDSCYHLIPWIDWALKMEDYELYQYFGFNKDEIKLIENAVQ